MPATLWEWPRGLGQMGMAEGSQAADVDHQSVKNVYGEALFT